MDYAGLKPALKTLLIHACSLRRHNLLKTKQDSINCLKVLKIIAPSDKRKKSPYTLKS